MLDPAGHPFYLFVPYHLIDDEAIEARRRVGRLDLAKEQARYGADTPGGVGVSHSPEAR